MFALQRPPARAQSQAIVEFALVVPLFLLLLFALIDFARLEFSYISLANATREMARLAAVSTGLKNPTVDNDHILDGFNNLALIASDWNGVNTDGTTMIDTVTITVADLCTTADQTATATAAVATPASTCAVAIVRAPIQVTTCKLTPVHPSLVTPSTPIHGLMHVAEGGGPPGTPPTGGYSCTVPLRSGAGGVWHGGSVEVVSTYQFSFNPMFQNRLTGMIDASFIQRVATLSTTARAYIE